MKNGLISIVYTSTLSNRYNNEIIIISIIPTSLSIALLL